MKKYFVTEEQACEIAEMTAAQTDALIAYGADLYRAGLFKGGTITVVGFAVGAVISIVLEKIIKKHKQITKD